MDRMVYIGMTGAEQIMQAMQANNNNLANANTTGFKSDLAAFKSIPVTGTGIDSRVYSVNDEFRTDFTPGNITTTGRELDVAIKDKGMIAVQSRSGQEAYTRAGNLSISSEGLLTTTNGAMVMGNSGPIAIPPNQSIHIGEDGTITIRPIGQSATSIARIDRIKLVNPDTNQLRKHDDGLFYMGEDGGGAAADASVKLQSGSLEGSNVNSVDALVNMISLTRSYEMELKIMKAAEDDDAASAEVMHGG